MAKPKLRDFKKYLSSLNEAELREELQKLFNKLPQVQEFYAQELMSESERKLMLDEYKKKIYVQFWTRGGNPRVANNVEVRKVISAFEKVSVFSHELVDLLLYHTETITKQADQFGDTQVSSYKASFRSFEKAIELMVKHKLEDLFRARCEELLFFNNLDYAYMDGLKLVFEQHIGT